MFLSGVTAFPILAELRLLSRVMGLPEIASPAANSPLDVWLVTVRNGLDDLYGRYPWIAVRKSLTEDATCRSRPGIVPGTEGADSGLRAAGRSRCS